MTSILISNLPENPSRFGFIILIAKDRRLATIRYQRQCLPVDVCIARVGRIDHVTCAALRGRFRSSAVRSYQLMNNLLTYAYSAFVSAAINGAEFTPAGWKGNGSMHTRPSPETANSSSVLSKPADWGCEKATLLCRN